MRVAALVNTFILLSPTSYIKLMSSTSSVLDEVGFPDLVKGGVKWGLRWWVRAQVSRGVKLILILDIRGLREGYKKIFFLTAFFMWDYPLPFPLRPFGRGPQLVVNFAIF